MRSGTYRYALNGFAGPIPGATLDALKNDPRVKSGEPDRVVQVPEGSARPLGKGGEAAMKKILSFAILSMVTMLAALIASVNSKWRAARRPREGDALVNAGQCGATFTAVIIVLPNGLGIRTPIHPTLTSPYSRRSHQTSRTSS